MAQCVDSVLISFNWVSIVLFVFLLATMPSIFFNVSFFFSSAGRHPLCFAHGNHKSGTRGVITGLSIPG
jgi:hypothetical protein